MDELRGGELEEKPCERCGHPSGKHVFHAEMPYPSEGWVTCPVPGCDCYGTWSLDPESRAAMDKYCAEHFAQQAKSESV
jgi:hypothetical protein